MPVYQCNECGKAFKRKNDLREHAADCTTTSGDTVFEDVKSSVSDMNLNFSPQRIRNMFTLRNMGIAFGVLMMATLFAGTASFMSSTASSSGSGPTGAVAAESNPALGYSIRSESDIPRLPASQRPDYISNTPLSTDQQLYVITQGGQNGPAALIHYNCETQCLKLEQQLASIAQNYQGWVYVAPNPEINSQIVVTGFQRIQRYDTFKPQELQGFVCSVTRNQPIACVGTPRQQTGTAGNQADTGNQTDQDDTAETGQ